MTDLPLSRQPACGHCSHEHMWMDCDRPGCGCPRHNPPGIYPQEAS